jgi:hypothetical protein
MHAVHHFKESAEPGHGGAAVARPAGTAAAAPRGTARSGGGWGAARLTRSARGRRRSLSGRLGRALLDHPGEPPPPSPLRGGWSLLHGPFMEVVAALLAVRREAIASSLGGIYFHIFTIRVPEASSTSIPPSRDCTFETPQIRGKSVKH